MNNFIKGLKVGDSVGVRSYERHSNLHHIRIFTVVEVNSRHTKVVIQDGVGKEIYAGLDLTDLLPVTEDLLRDKEICDTRTQLAMQIAKLYRGAGSTHPLGHSHISDENLKEALEHTAALLEMLKMGGKDEEN